MDSPDVGDETRHERAWTVRPRWDYDVVIPTTGRNWEFLRAAIDSVQRQTIAPARVIVVVDGHPGTADRLRRLDGVSVIAHPERRGAAAARQSGIEAATAEWVAFLDDDDLWARRKQERLFGFLEVHRECLAVRSGYWMFCSVPGTKGLFGQVPEITGTTLEELEEAAQTAVRLNDLDYLDIHGRSLELLLERNRGVIGTSMVKRDLLQSLPVVPAGLAPGDEHLLFCHVAANTEWHLLRERLQFYRLHGAQDSRTAGSHPARSILRAKRLAWEAHGGQARRLLESYGTTYSDELRSFWWTVLKQTRSPREALRVYRAGLALLPRRGDRLAALIPEPLVWRWRQKGRIVARRGSPAGGDAAPTW